MKCLSQLFLKCNRLTSKRNHTIINISWEEYPLKDRYWLERMRFMHIKIHLGDDAQCIRSWFKKGQVLVVLPIKQWTSVNEMHLQTEKKAFFRQVFKISAPSQKCHAKNDKHRLLAAVQETQSMKAPPATAWQFQLPLQNKIPIKHWITGSQ